MVSINERCKIYGGSVEIVQTIAKPVESGFDDTQPYMSITLRLFTLAVIVQHQTGAISRIKPIYISSVCFTPGV